MSWIAAPVSTRVERALDGLVVGAGSDYIGEPLSQLQHALQCAALARAAGAPDIEVLAALFHDVGHVIAPAGSVQMAGLGVHEHEQIGARWLAECGFAPAVCELVSAHVHAKRYLAYRNTGYLGRLSQASRGTLEFQGGPMSAAEAERFENAPLFAAKIRLRVWDEAAKEPDGPMPELAAFRQLVHDHLEQR